MKLKLTENQLKYVLSETIKASDAYDELNSIQTIIDGKRDIGFLGTTGTEGHNSKIRKLLVYAVENGLKIINVKNRDVGYAWVIYKNNVEGAKLLADFAASKGGYLRDETPEEALFVGELLGYSPESTQEYINHRYKNK